MHQQPLSSYKIRELSDLHQEAVLISNAMELKAAISLDTERLIKRVQDVLSQAKGKPVSYDEALREMAHALLEKKDPVRRAQRILSKSLTKQAGKHSALENKAQDLLMGESQKMKQSPKTNQLLKKDSPLRQPIRARLKHELYLRDQGRCQFKNCGDSRWVFFSTWRQLGAMTDSK